jgi:hypothetical protein
MHVERALDVHWPCPIRVGWPKATNLGRAAGPRPRVPLCPWAAVWPMQIVKFSIFFKIIQIEIQFKFGLGLNTFEFY